MGFLFTRAQIGKRGVAPLRGELEVLRRARGERVHQRAEARRQVADHADVELVVEGEPLRGFLDLRDGGASGDMAAGRVPDVLEERAAEQ